MKEEGSYILLSREDKLRAGIVEDSIINLVDALLHEAITLQASDIHLQPTMNGLAIRFRIDGVLYTYYELEKEQAPLIVSRIKILANVDISQKRLPQDGHFKVVICLSMTSDTKSVVDFRVASYPTLYGEKIVVRILDRAVRLLPLNALGLSDATFKRLCQIMNQPHGLFLVTGPTGCGKTTMLYALLSLLNIREKNIITIEDPVEYELTGIAQGQVNDKVGFTFENGLRAILRQDPDVVMIGEIRDKATATIAIEAALTGHLVLSTLHTNDAASAVTRLIEMGIEPFLISATLSAVLAQRLVRCLCQKCKKKQAPDPMFMALASDHQLNAETIFQATGCGGCRHIGYQGRKGIFELLPITEALRDLIVQKATASIFRQQAQKEGFNSLVFDGLCKVRDGMTSMQELLSVVLQKQ